MGLLRLATVAAIAIALLPSDKEQQQRLYQRAGDTAEWVVTFCDRNATVCAKSAELWTQFVAKAQFGAQLAYDMARERYANSGSMSNASLRLDDTNGTTVAPAVLERDSGTLTPFDKAADWRGKRAPHNGI
ncbi:DUF5330 domain-containing protein [Hyphomicrobium sp.]|uniref:DUF5330 domain-containing protein n=1 Tax=Hyphomicrobium sp. TaxID=82 RepID=UPI000FA9DFD0|nr:DUF5330 domain-containing protein [Hyphomicrobium sp.]RUO99194.1 MAG: hypothetical protein EKK30_08105 [Hyphomicrobium sp.]